MVGGFLCRLAAPVCWPIAAAGGAVCDAALAAIEVAVDLTARIPGAFHWVSGPPVWWTVGWYAGLMAMLLLLAGARLMRPSVWACAAGMWAAVGLAVGLVLGAVRVGEDVLHLFTHATGEAACESGRGSHDGQELTT
jgi:hypothetical protein